MMETRIEKGRKIMPEAIFCPKCAGPIKLVDIPEADAQTKIYEQGYDEGARGMCGCGVVVVVCVMHLPKSPTFAIFMDIFEKQRQPGGQGIRL